MRPADISRILSLHQTEPMVYCGEPLDSVRTRTFGGQLIGQAAVAAQCSAPEERCLQSLHAYFLAPGTPQEQIEFRVVALREGRTYSQRRVTAWQADRQILEVMASLRRGEDDGPRYRTEMPQVPAPAGVPRVSVDDFYGSQDLLAEWRDVWDIRFVSSASGEWPGDTCQAVWIRCTARIPSDEAFHRSLLTYLTDMTVLYAAMRRHPTKRTALASLDHAVWIYRQPRVDEWLLYVQDSPVASGGRSLVRGLIYDQAGQVVAAVGQEGLTRW